jgi:chorismate-pyruvate lyase
LGPLIDSGPETSPLSPLDELYAAAGLPMPRVEVVADSAIPAAQRALLTGSGSLTHRLEVRERQSLALRVLERTHDGDMYARRVVLLRSEDATALALGAIKVDLALLPPAVKAAILAEEEPFGRIVRDGTTLPARLFRVVPDASIRLALGLVSGEWLYGRRRMLVNGRGGAIASIVEILAP